MITPETLAKYRMTIGIESHVQLATATKLFSPADNDARDASPNSKVHLIDYGLPGMLPILNREAINLAIRAAKALNADVAHVSRFDRKHYFYPDLPNGYQITQMYEPTILAGVVEAPLEDGGVVRVRIHHAHLESDAGKLTHYGDYTLADYNRAGTPLIEIVTEPDMHSSAEAKAFCQELHRLMMYAGVSRGDLYHGNQRFDVNISVAPADSNTLGTRAEIKNLNSFRSIERAVEYEFRRQVELLERGERVVQETRGWNDAKQITTSQRSKEDAQDYRYMPDADIPPVVLTPEQIASVQAEVPMLPPEYRAKWAGLHLDKSVVNTLLDSPDAAQLVNRLIDIDIAAARKTSFWLMKCVGDETRGYHAGADITNGLVQLSQMVDANQVSSNSAETIFFEMITTSREDAKKIAEEKNLLQVSDEGAIAAIVDAVMTDPASATSIADITAGKDKAIGYLVGQVMKQSQGKANPGLAQTLIRERLDQQK